MTSLRTHMPSAQRSSRGRVAQRHSIVPGVAPHPIVDKLPPMLVSDKPGTWAYDTMSRRIREEILSRVFEDNQFPPEQLAALQALDQELQSAKDVPLRHVQNDGGPDLAAWKAAMSEYVDSSATWLTTPWLTAEFYFYRRILEAISYFETKEDPFQQQKDMGLTSAAVPIQALTSQLAGMSAGFKRASAEETVASLDLFVLTALWGNRMDLSLWPAGDDTSGSRASDSFSEALDAGAAQLLTSDVDAVVSELMAAKAAGGKRMDIVVDNAGFELLCDLCLADVLVETGAASKVVLQLKGHPTFVSDALAKDVLATCDFVEGLGGGSESVARRWRSHIENGAWEMKEVFYWCQPQPFWDMPEEVVSDLKSSAMVFVKGDANYRRLLGDCEWDLTTPFEKVAGYFPAPLCALRTLKAELGCGMPASEIQRASSSDENWLTNGRWGVVQHYKP
eukprot:CAMPEP_0114299282 /NCGR_PEP_ID=MMETSP0059-20121206/12887_1 /TAXON_ID=36894 /ORGANISM="Pyramimonas parkeae, Strain CCMP726" /LENGTH=449 /DNA_ID=CAMNT_0001421737 /DNA_START=77 /DNA_END=1426 /DNA_ORIENTATION=-